jgi:hypothetical protein
MSNIDTGGPAFPHDAIEDLDAEGCFYGGHPGMTLRDHFAGLTMQGILASKEKELDYETRAAFSYKQADATLKARTAPATNESTT